MNGSTNMVAVGWLGLALGLAGFMASPVSADDIIFNPVAPNFGSLAIGESASMNILVINNNGPQLVRSAELREEGAFRITYQSEPTPLYWLGGDEEKLVIEVTFTPTTVGSADTVLEVVAGGVVYAVTITGYGVPATVLSQMDGILAFFDASVAANTLVGAGPGKSADGRLGALRNMIEEARRLILEGYVADACDQLQDALNRVDGDPHIPDFAAGAAAGELAARLDGVLDVLGCP